MRNDVQVGRLVRAAAIVAALVLAVPSLSLVVGQQSEGGSGGGAGSALVRLPRSEVAASDPFAALQAVEDSIQGSAVPVPGYFEEEIGLPIGCRDVRTDGESVVGFVIDDEVSEVMRLIDARMRDGGWSPVPLGETEGATYVKEGGACRWALVTCTQVGDASSVVYRCIAR